jgi:hypothetical protein
MENQNKPLFSFQYEKKIHKTDLIIARLFGFALGVVACAVFVFIIIF